MLVIIDKLILPGIKLLISYYLENPLIFKVGRVLIPKGMRILTSLL